MPRCVSEKSTDVHSVFLQFLIGLSCRIHAAVLLFIARVNAIYLPVIDEYHTF